MAFHLEKFSLNFASLSFAICVNLLHLQPSVFPFGLFLPLWCFSNLENYCLEVSFQLTTIFNDLPPPPPPPPKKKKLKYRDVAPLSSNIPITSGEQCVGICSDPFRRGHCFFFVFVFLLFVFCFLFFLLCETRDSTKGAFLWKNPRLDF